ncbi:MAG TPA: TIGR03364 family FAD-dependent oxidoreductase [Saprospiraceae bacterium]|nr:TIGR03364 family FAD-dependent oxidoreductase [Saprospiraceae bacterium]
MQQKYDVAIVGAGIVGLATAYAAASKGLKTIVFERNPRAIGASIRNFGLIWPIGQPPGNLLDRAMRSRETWIKVARESGLRIRQNGSLQLAYHDDEMEVLHAFKASTQGAGYEIELLNPEETLQKSSSVRAQGLKGAMFSNTECTVTSREAIPQLAQYLEMVHGVEFHFGSAVTHVDTGLLSDFYDTWHAERIFICSGAEFETLYPRVFRESGITKCKLQMLRTAAQPKDWQLGPSLCAGLTLLHYQSFAHLQELQAVKHRYEVENADYARFGIHVLVSQNHKGEIILGDSHEYGWDVSPFDSDAINRLILHYLNGFAAFPDMQIAETWHGVYPKLPGKTELVMEIEPGVWIVNGLSGAGMTMSFGLTEELFV